MPKMKTHKAASKRFVIKKSKKRDAQGNKTVTVLKRTDGQDHFNSRESGNTKRNKRRDNSASNPLKKMVVKLLPHI
jgi:ribosomal protein L35